MKVTMHELSSCRTGGHKQQGWDVQTAEGEQLDRMSRGIVACAVAPWTVPAYMGQIGSGLVRRLNQVII
jgi:hypothetical protein